MAKDPRDVITPDAFSVAPELLGKPLARPSRRALAMLIDLIAIAVLTRAGWFFLGLGLSYVLLRLARSGGRGAVATGSRWLTFGSLGAIVLLVTLAGGWASCLSDGIPVEITGDEPIFESTFGDAGGAVADFISLRRAENEEEVREATHSLADRLERQGAGLNEIRETLMGLAETEMEPWAYEAIGAALRERGLGATVTDAVAGDSLVLSFAAALSSGDSARLAELRPQLADAIAADQLERQREHVRTLEARNEELGERLREAEEGPGVVRTILRVADEVGIGFGWSGLYFTFFLAVWRGTTPGKRVLRIRVVRLDGAPIGWWAAFNRFGGYAASIFTGLIGFFEMFWDANRQALHDRIAATVVIKE